MTHRLLAWASVASLSVGLLAGCATPGTDGTRYTYPVTRQVDQVDTYFDTRVADPYRWLEDDNAADTKAWVSAQNQVTRAYLDSSPTRAPLRQRLGQLMNHERLGGFHARAGKLFYFRNSGLQNQSVMYWRDEAGGPERVLLDPNAWSSDGTVKLAGYVMSTDGRYMAYGISKGGSDWADWRIMDLRTQSVLPETLTWIKHSQPSWLGDGFYYSRYPAPADGKALSGANVDQKVYYHRVGTEQTQDRLVYEEPAKPARTLWVGVSEDQRYEFLGVVEPGLRGNSLAVRPAGSQGAFVPLVPSIGKYRHSVVHSDERYAYVRTSDGAPNGQLLRYDLQLAVQQAAQPVTPQVLIAERETPLSDIDPAGGQFYAVYLKDVTSQVVQFDAAGRVVREITLPGKGTASGFWAEPGAKTAYYTYASFNRPATVYALDIASGQSRLVFETKLPGINPDDFQVEQVFYPSRDGTRIPMFIVAKKGLPRNGSAPTLLYGYGGFNLSLQPWFSSTRLAWLEQGGVFALANLRGGAEYGERWHEAGMRLNKQNVFDDFIAAGEYLIAQGYTSRARLAVQGGSNGGTLVGAVINQRPELFGAAVPEVGVMDMLRYHRFTAGKHWVSEYGASDQSEADFKNIYAYSPLHNIRPGVTYPATLVTTADHDDRVVPAHSFKYAATLQAKANPARPALIRIDTNSGHGASSTTKALEHATDLYTFLFKALGVQPSWP